MAARKPERIDKVWGWEEVIVNNDRYCGKLLYINEGATTSFHYHDVKHETFYVMGGTVTLTRELVPFGGTQKQTLLPGDIVELKPKCYHQLFGVTDACVVEFSTPHSDSDVFRLTESKAAPHE